MARKRDASTSQWTAAGVTGASLVPAYLVEISAGVMSIDSEGPGDGVWIATGTAGVVALDDSGVSAAFMASDGTVTSIYGSE